MKLRVLIVDDSAFMRRLLCHALEGDPEIEIAGVAANGTIALALLEQHGADAVVLDVDMPEMDGVETLRALRARGRRMPVIMFSMLTERGALATLEALAAGADDCVAKPADTANAQESLQRIRAEVVPRIKALCWKSHPGSRGVAPPASLPGSAAIHFPEPPPPALAKIDVVAIGASAGGPNALTAVLANIPAGFPVPVVIVQHMPPIFTRFLAQHLSASSPLPVREAFSGAELLPGQVWLAPGDFHMALCGETDAPRLAVFQAPPQNFCRPSVDVLFHSVAEHFGQHALAVVLTGMGHDGLRGCESIAQARGQIVVQDEGSSVVWGMPGYVARAGLASSVLPLDQIADEILRRVSRARRDISAAPAAIATPQAVRLNSL
jgi:two-component system, chemotaxis family, protein-glutamate methylesterase/glutaminase